MKTIQFFFILLLLFFLISCQGSKNEQAEEVTIEETIQIENNCVIKINDTILTIDNRDIHIIVCNATQPQGTLLLLHGWNFKPDDWCMKTAICEKAIEEGYHVVMPDMGKSNYHTQVFPETRKDWKGTPTLLWLTDTVIPNLQEFCLLLQNEKNVIVGLSTGGRGAVCVAMQMPHLFRGVAALSGDFDQSTIPNDRVHIGFYGSYSKFQERWKSIDNPTHNIYAMKTPLYLAHGTQDKVTPHYQSQNFYDSLKKINPSLFVEIHLPDAAHDYEFWASEVDNIFNFFSRIPSIKD
jgi:S-formylglutathione hydrolase FrmB